MYIYNVSLYTSMYICGCVCCVCGGGVWVCVGVVCVHICSSVICGGVCGCALCVGGVYMQ